MAEAAAQLNPTNGLAKPESQSLATPRQPAPLIPTNLEEAWRLATALANSTIIPTQYVNQPGNIMAAIMMGTDLGISPMQAMREVYVVEGRPSSSALLKVGLVLQSSLCEYWTLVESTDTKAIFETKRRGAKQPTRLTYTIEDAKVAGLYPGKDNSNWRKRPKLMLRRRCESELADEVYPDVVKGLRTEDEAQEMTEREVLGSHTVETVAPPLPSQPPAAERPIQNVVNDLAKAKSMANAAPVQEKPVQPELTVEREPEAQTTGGAPDPVDVLLDELKLADSKGIDELAERAKTLVPKGHARRNEVGAAVNAARKRVQ